MIACHAQSSSAKEWIDLYLAALMECNNDIALSRISKAERAIVERARELFKSDGDNIEEEESLDDALYALHALKSCLAMHGRFAETT